MNILNLTQGLLTVREIATLCGITVQAVYKWSKSERGIPAEHCRTIECATKGAVTRYDLRPDVFGVSDKCCIELINREIP
jgi:DNA-binding transcriptional regulator YdaS (Cro superfamily)